MRFFIMLRKTLLFYLIVPTNHTIVDPFLLFCIFSIPQ
ncbi:hypothetical protein KR50_22350 [Jeotgalibacillus campisalis]|uniref:Uncharacterized protein n=1 Tax=Jeotgalibacillus campisalis TaxID=220754 RepID=A0A0C2VVR7_9BACL|nr:hypothetical protein KR50_22350 [Jeotgalibacillus campisalis]